MVGRRTRQPTRRGGWGGQPPLGYRRRGRSLAGLLPAAAQALPTGPQRPAAQGEGQPRLVEAFRCGLPARCGGLVRSACAFSKARPLRAARIKICLGQQNPKAVLTWTAAENPGNVFVGFFALPEVYLSPSLLFRCMYSEGA